LSFFTKIYDFYTKDAFVLEIAAAVTSQRSLGAGQSGDFLQIDRKKDVDQCVVEFD
jgi:hypothetical protein